MPRPTPDDGLGILAVTNTEEVVEFEHVDEGTGVLHDLDPYNELLTVAPYVPLPVTCSDKCVEQDRLARQHCDMIRKRVAQWMKDSGCPSSVKGMKRRKRTCRKSKSKL